MTPLGWLGRKTSTQTNIYSVLPLLVFLSGRWFNMTELLLTAPKETICMKCQSLFSGKNRKNISKCHQLKILPSMQSVNNVCHTALAVFFVFFLLNWIRKQDSFYQSSGPLLMIDYIWLLNWSSWHYNSHCFLLSFFEEKKQKNYNENDNVDTCDCWCYWHVDGCKCFIQAVYKHSYTSFVSP